MKKYSEMTIAEFVAALHVRRTGEDKIGCYPPKYGRDEIVAYMRAILQYLLEQEAEQRTCEISGGWFPRRVLFFAVPPVDGKACQLCALTQIESGRCYLFTPDCTPILVYAIQGRKLYCL